MSLKQWITGLGYKLEIQTGGSIDSPIYTDISNITLSSSESFNDLLDTFHTLASPISSTVKTGVDPEFTLTAKGDKSHAAMQALLGTIWATGADAVKMVRLTNTWAMKVVTFPATISGYAPTFETPTVVEVPWSLKPYDGSAVLVSDVESIAPVVETYSPAEDATDVSVSAPLVLTFAEDVLKGVGNINIFKTAGDVLVESINVQLSNVSIAGEMVTVSRSVVLTAGTEYYVQITAGAFKDIVGNAYAGISDKTTWKFTTAA